MHAKVRRKRCHGFSLIELVIVVVIIGIIAAIAIPRMTHATKGAGESALEADLNVVRNAIELYAAEHAGSYPDVGSLKDNLTQSTNAMGTVGTSAADYPYGPYLREIPAQPVGSTNKGSAVVTNTDGSSGGWVYKKTTGGYDFHANTLTAADSQGTDYKDY